MHDMDFDKILREILKDGGEYAEIYMERTRTTRVQLDDGKVESAQTGIDMGVGLRLIKDLKSAYAYTNELKESTLLELARSLKLSAADSGSAQTKPVTEIKPGLVQEIKKSPELGGLNNAASLTSRADKAARGADNRIKQVQATYMDSEKKVTVANSLGVIANETRIQIVFLVHVVASDGNSIQTGFEPVGGAIGLELFDDTTPEEVALCAARRALLMLDARLAPAGTMPVVLSSEAGGTMIHEAVGHGLESDLANEKLSVYSGKMGETIASKVITVVDDATIPGKRGSAGFDDEGTPSRKTLLIDKGTLKGFMYDRLSAMKVGGQSTGNGRRQDYRHRPIPRMTNTMIMPGDMDPDEIIRSVDRGLLVKRMGGGQVNTVNGDFVFAIDEAYMLENGKVGDAVREATLVGNGPKVLMEIDMVGNDLGYGLGTCGKDGQGSPVADAQPTLRIPQITIGGKVAPSQEK